MGWAVGYDSNWKRWIGYGVPATCDHPGCDEKINRGLPFVCGEQPPGYNEFGCGLHFCGEHLYFNMDHPEAKGICLCESCSDGKEPFDPKPESKEWLEHLLTDASWEEWRQSEPEEVERYQKMLEKVWHVKK